MKSTMRTRLRRGVAVGLSVALVTGASLVAAAPAHAGVSVAVFASDIAPDESTYTGWHQGYAGGIATVTAEGLQLEGRSQIINGLDTPLDINALAAVADGQTSWTTTADSAPAFFQIPVNFGSDDSKGFTTLRPAAPTSGTNTISLDQEWSTSRVLGQYQANAVVPLSDLLSELNALGNVEVLAFGVLSNEGTTSVVTSINWLNTDYTFHADPLPELPAGTVTVTGDYTLGSTLTGTSTGWPAGTVLSYQWGYGTGVMGGAIEGATGTSYTITADRVGQFISLVVTGTLPGYEPNWANSISEVRVTAPQKPAAAPPATDSASLAAYLASQGIPLISQTEVGLPTGALSPVTSYTPAVPWPAGDSFVDVHAFSTPVLIGTFPVVNGVVQIPLSSKVLSQLAAGNHTLVVTGQTSGAVKAISFNIAVTLAATGSNAVAPIGAATLLLMLGAALVVARRRSVRA